MGGAERAERRRRQQQAQQLATKATKGPKGSKEHAEPGKRAATVDRARARKVALGIGAAAAVVAVVIGGVVWFNADKNATQGQVIAAKSAEALPEKRDGAVVVVGSEKAPVTIDVYADFLCPACQQFEQRDAKAIAAKVRAGELRVLQHMVPMLSERSDPPGYSMDAANAALCAADEGKFTAFHDSLFAAQPEEGKRAWDKGQLTKLGTKLGLGEGFASCVARRTYHAELDKSLATASADIPDFGTPTVIGPDGRVDLSQQGWLDRLN